MRRIHVSTRSQLFAVGALALLSGCGVAGAAGVALNAPGVSKTITEYAQRTGEVAAMEDRVAALQNEVSAIRRDATKRADMLAKRQAFLANLLNGSGDAKVLASLLSVDGTATTNASRDVLAAFGPVDVDQVRMASALRAMTDAKTQQGTAVLSKLGLDPNRAAAAAGGMGGPYEPVDPNAAKAPQAGAQSPVQADPQFRALFNSWKRLDQVEQAIGGIPSYKPVQSVSINSGFGVRSDPFMRRAAMHAGVDMPAPLGTPIYATADGIVGRAGRAGGYGNLIELEHGRGIQTRYGHLSQINVPAGAKVKRGQLIGLMGSTGRSTGSHLHYEVRIDGRAVNPIPFLQSSDYLLALQNRTNATTVGLGGPAKAE